MPPYVDFDDLPMDGLEVFQFGRVSKFVRDNFWDVNMYHVLVIKGVLRANRTTVGHVVLRFFVFTI